KIGFLLIAHLFLKIGQDRPNFIIGEKRFPAAKGVLNTASKNIKIEIDGLLLHTGPEAKPETIADFLFFCFQNGRRRGLSRGLTLSMMNRWLGRLGGRLALRLCVSNQWQSHEPRKKQCNGIQFHRNSLPDTYLRVCLYYALLCVIATSLF